MSGAPLMYLEGPGDLVAAHRSWRSGIDHPSETSVTFSSQFFDACKRLERPFVAISHGGPPGADHSAGGTAMNRPRKMFRLRKVGYDLSLLVYTLRVAVWILRYRPSHVLVASGVVRWWALDALRAMLGVEMIPVLHNTLWPPSREIPSRPVAEHAWWRGADPPSTLVVSPAIRRQVSALGALAAKRCYEFRPLFRQSAFPPSAERDLRERPVRLIFVGRLEPEKGAVDLIEIMRMLRDALADGVRLDVCGAGSASGDVSRRIHDLGLQRVVRLRGRLDRTALVWAYSESHLCLVPTRSSFGEGYAQVVAESVLLGRPVVASRLVPATEVLPDAVVAVEPDVPSGYVEAVLRLIDDPDAYAALCRACLRYRERILQSDMSFGAVLGEVVRQSKAG